MSADGSAAAVSAPGPARWARTGPTSGVTTPLPLNSQITCISPDGTTIFDYYSERMAGSDYHYAHRSRPPYTASSTDSIPCAGRVQCVSGDGQFAGGYVYSSTSSPSTQHRVWSLPTGGAPTCSWITFPEGTWNGTQLMYVSRSRSIVVGNVIGSTSEGPWTPVPFYSRPNEVSQILGPAGRYSVTALSGDGLTVAGVDRTQNAPVSWRMTPQGAGMPTLLPLPAGTQTGHPNAVSFNGSVIAMSAGTTAATINDFIYRDGRGFIQLTEYLPRFGASLTGWSALHIKFISDDGLTVGGNGIFQGTAAGFIATLPKCGTADFNGDGDAGTDQDIEAFFACIAGSCCASCWPLGSDFNNDGDYGTEQDIEAFFRVLGGHPC
jgi:hypothetical protein